MQTPTNTPLSAPTHDRTEDHLRAEIEELKRKLREQQRGTGHGPHARRKPSAGTLWGLAILGGVILAGAFLAGYLPQAKRQTALAKEARLDSTALPLVNVMEVRQAAGKS